MPIEYTESKGHGILLDVVDTRDGDGVVGGGSAVRGTDRRIKHYKI